MALLREFVPALGTLRKVRIDALPIVLADAAVDIPWKESGNVRMLPAGIAVGELHSLPADDPGVPPGMPPEVPPRFGRYKRNFSRA